MVQRVLTDNGGGYISNAFRAVVQAQEVRHKRTRPFRPQTNGKAEAFNKILQAEWAYLRPYASNAERLALLADFPIMPVPTAASRALSLLLACKQCPWELHLDGLRGWVPGLTGLIRFMAKEDVPRALRWAKEDAEKLGRD